MLVGVDVGTTHCKAGLFATDGRMLALAHCVTPTRRAADGAVFYEPDELWSVVAGIIREVAGNTSRSEITVLGIASMAETGVLLDRHTHRARSPMIPWFDRAAVPYAEQIALVSDRFERFCATGQYPNFKSGLAKLLWLRAQQPAITEQAIWLSAADYIAYRLTGELRTDYTLAARTYAFRLDSQAWDTDWLSSWGLRAEVFPIAQPSGTPAGSVRTACARELGLASETLVAIAGHDHVCGAFAVGAIEPGMVFDSMGTAETLIGAIPDRRLGQDEYDSGLTYGCHVVNNRLYWMGGLSASGGSLEWLRALLGNPPLDYDDLRRLVESAGAEPTGILYVPYLLGSGTPHPDQHVKGAFIGLHAGHTRAHVVKAVLEGTAYELEFIRRAAEQGTKTAISTMIAAGGGTRSQHWMQIKADVGGCALYAPSSDEATVLGAALLAGIGCGLYAGAG